MISAGYITVKPAVERAMHTGRDSVTGQFTKISAELEQDCAAAAADVAEQIAMYAEANAAGSGYRFPVFYFPEPTGGSSYDVQGEGQFVDMLEFGSPAHPIGSPGQWLINEAVGGRAVSNYPDPSFGFRRGPVMHPGTRACHCLGRAAAEVDATGTVIRHINL